MKRQQLISRSLAALAAFAGISCGNTMNGGNAANGTCTATLSGAVNASYSCYAVVTYDSTGDNSTQKETAFAIGVNGASADALYADLVLSLAQSFKVGGYGVSDTVLDEITVSQGSGTPQVWLMSQHATSTADQGTFSLAITSTGTTYTLSTGGTGYLNPQGTLTATLLPQTSSGASGTVTLDISFSGSGS